MRIVIDTEEKSISVEHYSRPAHIIYILQRELPTYNWTISGNNIPTGEVNIDATLKKP